VTAFGPSVAGRPLTSVAAALIRGPILLVMPFVGSIIPPAAFGEGPNAPNVKRRTPRERRVEQGDSFKRHLEDEASLTSVEPIETRAVTGPSSHESEEGHEDRAEHGAYDPSGPESPTARRPGKRLDLQG